VKTNMDDRPEAIITVEAAIASIAAADWDACANPSSRSYNPFVSHAFLKALEESGSVGPDSSSAFRKACDTKGL